MKRALPYPVRWKIGYPPQKRDLNGVLPYYTKIKVYPLCCVVLTMNVAMFKYIMPAQQASHFANGYDLFSKLQPRRVAVDILKFKKLTIKLFGSSLFH